MIQAARLHRDRHFTLEKLPAPPAPREEEVLIEVLSVGICGSDLHYYQDGRIGPTVIEEPFILGHEFSGRVIAVGSGAVDGNHQPLTAGQRVAVDPMNPCYQCEMCEKGYVNLCCNHTFFGAYPTGGAMRERMICPARNCFPIPDDISNGAAALLETVGVAIHAVDLGKIKLGSTVAVIGCGPVGLLILRLAKLAGATELYAFDKYSWRVEKASAWGAAYAATVDQANPIEAVLTQTQRRGVDVAFEAAWVDETVEQCVAMAAPGGRVVVVGIPVEDNVQFSYSTAARKGLSILLARRMQHTYPRAIALATSGDLDLDDVISHHYQLEDISEAFARNHAYEAGIHKVVIDIHS
ncbi:MAG: alcohol dehydrogenase catalytic domain-containing protein [Chloroflexi bacterium]|nr:alcohol dehydrogenase catalytic domain-containing protein [Chloroflexota bacterium]